MMMLLLTNPLERAQAQEIGLALSHLGLGAKAMVRTQEGLADSIIGYTELMLMGFDGALNDEQRKDLTTIVT